MKKCLLAFILVSCSTMSFADMPNINNMSSEKSERITNGDLSCETRSPTPTINAGVYNSDNQRAYYNGVNEKDQGMYVGISIPLYSKSKSVSCDNLYQLTLKKEQLRVQQLEMQIEMMKSRRLVAE